MQRQPLLGLPCAGIPATNPPPPPPHRLVAAGPSVVPWTGDQELLGWRVWRLGLCIPGRRDYYGPRLLSFTAHCIWNGPVVTAVRLPDAIETPSGIYALKVDLPTNEWCWVTGWVALSGRVIEHELGYRAERAVVRELRLGVGTHLAVRSLQQLREVMDGLEDRYQVSVDAGLREREIADRMLSAGKKPECPKLPFVWAKPPWQLI
jgi:hypothetical protein